MLGPRPSSRWYSPSVRFVDSAESAQPSRRVPDTFLAYSGWVRRWAIITILWAACTAFEEPAQDPLDYLRVGVSPSAEADAVIADLERHGFVVGRKFVEPRYTAFDATRGPDSTVRIVTRRGSSFAAQTPDVRAPRRIRLSLSTDPRPDFDEDGVPDIVVQSRELERTCLVWLQVADEGFVTTVFRPEPAWGDLPCVIDLEPDAKRLWLEVTVPGSASATSRVVLPVRGDPDGWTLDDRAQAEAHWAREIDRRRALRAATNDQAVVARIDAELAWIHYLRAGSDDDQRSEGVVHDTTPMLEAPEDGQEAR